VGIIATVAEQPLRLGQVVEQGCRASVVADVMKKLKGRPSASLTAWSLMFMPPLVRPVRRPKSPFVTRRLDAVRSAFRKVASIITVFGTGSAAASPSIMRNKTPRSPHRFHRL
jgi:hypothetical protein